MSTNISKLSGAGQEIEEIPVRISYEIIRLFSEGLYQSPHKAIEELVSNGYDADASRVHILLPEKSDNKADFHKNQYKAIEELVSSGHDADASRVHVLLPEQSDNKIDVPAPLWIIDDGHGMDVHGFRQLWWIAYTNKDRLSPSGGRALIGQFGIGKLAAYVLAWKLTHISCVDDKLLLTTMDFRKVTGRQKEGADPVKISLREVDEATAKMHLAEIEHRDPTAWELMFGGKRQHCTWTAAGMSDFRDLYNKLSTGTLKWVLSTGLPLHANFKIWLNGEQVVSSKENIPEIQSISIDKDLPGIGNMKGIARIHEKQLTTGKSEQIGRSHGFFIRVRERVINLEDELFGIQQPNHAAWSRFALEVNADGLRDHLLSSREGVRNSEEIRAFRKYLLDIFNQCRTAYEEWNRKENRKENEQLDIIALLSENPSTHVTEPLIRSVRNTVETGSESFYIGIPGDVEEENHSAWLTKYEEEVSEKPFDETKFVHYGPNAPALRYDPVTRSLVVNADHPFVDKLTDGDKHRNPAKLFASSEVLLEGQLQDQGIDRAAIANFLRDRDRVLRLMAGDAPPTAVEVLRRLGAASEDHAALERAVGAVFQVLGFEYERKGGNAPGPDGVLYARLGRHKGTLADYRLIYDAKQTNHPSVSADKIDLASLEEFRKQKRADFGFFIATAYAAEMEPDGALNRRINSEKSRCLALLKIQHLNRLIWLHYQHGVTLTELRTMFENAHTVPKVNDWIDSLESKLKKGIVPLSDLLHGLEREKSDPKAVPSVIAVRAKHQELQEFEPERLIARLKAVENIIGSRWIEVEESGSVFMHQTADQILIEFDRNIGTLIDTTNDQSSERL